jgi:hypothetical protein
MRPSTLLLPTGHIHSFTERIGGDGPAVGQLFKRIAVLAALPFLLSGCAGQPGGEPEISHGSLEQAQLELRVLDTVAGPAEAAYVPADRTVYLTVYVDDVGEMTEADIEAVHDAAAAELAGDRIEVVVAVDDGTVPGSD